MYCIMGELIFCITLTLLMSEYCLAWRSFTFRFDAVECLPYNDIANFVNCSIIKLKRNQEAFNLNVRFSVNLVQPKLDFQIINARPDDKDFVLVNFTNVDGCSFLQDNHSFNILQIIRKEFKKFSNLPDMCPIKKNTDINIKNLILDADNFPPYVPETKFRVVVLTKEKGHKIFLLVVRGRVESKKKLVVKKN